MAAMHFPDKASRARELFSGIPRRLLLVPKFCHGVYTCDDQEKGSLVTHQ